MIFRRFLILILLVALGAVSARMWFASPSQKSGPDDKSSSPHATAMGAPVTQPRPESSGMTSSVSPGAPMVRTEPKPAGSVNPALLAVGATAARPEPDAQGTADLEAVRFMFRDFRTRMGENPVGSNAEIMRAVMGGNPAGATLGPPTGQTLNSEGELVDRWGTPYFFHQLSKTNMEIRSAGPDRQMWTADDLVTK